MSSQGAGYRLLQICEGFLLAVTLALPALLKANPNALPEWMTPLRGWIIYIQGVTWILLFVAAVLLFFVRLAKEKLGERWIVDAVRGVLNLLRDKAVPRGNRGDPVHYHRVTLFRYKRWYWCLQKWPWTGWLVPIARSEHTTQRVRSVFRVPDDADKAEGVAGMSWTTQTTVVVSDLPNLYASNVSQDDFRVYARETRISEETAKRKKPHSRSFMGWPISVKGQKWGVIVIDSRSPEFEGRAKVQHVYGAVADPLQRYLEKLS